MRTGFAILLIAVPLLAACGKAEEPMLPELKGNWAMTQLMKSRDARLTKVQQVSSQPQASPDPCRVAHVTFGKSAIKMHTLGFGISLFHVTALKREGPRLILTGTADGDKNPAAQGKLVLLVRDGEVRFDDLYDERDRSIRYERLPDDHKMRKDGAATVGEMMKLMLDVKPCPSA